MSSSTPSGSTNRTRWLVAAAVLVVVVLVIWVVAQSDDEPGSSTSNPTSTASPGAGSTGQPVESQALIDLSESGRSAAFHAVYEGTVEEAADATGFTSVELWRSDGWTRQDTTTVSPDGTSRTQGVRSPEGIVTLCVLRDGVWGCTEQQTDTDNDIFLTAATLMAESSAPVAREATIGEHAATCFSDPAEPDAEVCYRDDGVPLRLATEPGVGLEITSIETDVDDSVFTTPEDGSTEDAGE